MKIFELFEECSFNEMVVLETFLEKIEALEKELEALKAEKGGK